jgi:peptidoglycan/LPS O-acetylase OafA/YrhL
MAPVTLSADAIRTEDSAQALQSNRLHATNEPQKQHGLKYRRDIDGLRAIAVLGVVLFHALPVLSPGGFAGVDIFFVISGFLISSIIFGSLQTKSFSFFNFYLRRIRRIFPPLILVLAFCLVFGWFVLLPGEYKTLADHASYAAGFVVNVVFNREAGYFDAASETKVLLHLWSLCIEEQFYLIWPLVVFAGWKMRRSLPAMISLAMIASFVLNVRGAMGSSPGAFFLAQNRFWELLIGGMLAYGATVCGAEARKPVWAGAASLTGLALIAGSFLFLGNIHSYPGFWALLPTTGAALLIWAGPNAWVNRSILSHRMLVSIGSFSYPLYLWHWPLLSFTAILHFRRPTILMNAAVVEVSFVLAFLSNRFIESRIRAGQGDRRPSWVIPVALSAGLAGIGAAGMEIGWHHGYPQRFAQIQAAVSAAAAGGSHPLAQDIINYKPEYKAAWRYKQCFLDTDQSARSFVPGCVEQTPADEPLVLLWGDSNAASLAPGLRDLERRERSSFRLGQLTSAGCPPVLGVPQAGYVHCLATNDTIYKQLGELKPAWIVLSVQRYGADPADLERLQRSIAMVRQAAPGVRIVLVGPSPLYAVTLPAYAARQYLLMWHVDVPQRAILQMDEEQQTGERDRIFARFAANHRIEYVSLFDILCNADGCMVRVPYDESHDDLVQFDGNHLTVAGSRYVADAMAPLLMR